MNVFQRAQPNYYTRPEQVSIPDYRPPRQRVPPPVVHSQVPPHQLTSGGHFRPFAWVGPQPKAGSPQTSYYNEAPNKGQFPNGLPPLPPNWQQYPVQMIWIPDTPGQPQPNTEGPGKGQYPYYPGPGTSGGPVGPPQLPTQTGSYGLYGPKVSTEEPMKPSAYPETYTGIISYQRLINRKNSSGTIAHSPAVNPISTTIPYEPSNPYGGRQTSVNPSTSSNPFEESTNPYDVPSTESEDRETGRGHTSTNVPTSLNPSPTSTTPSESSSETAGPTSGSTRGTSGGTTRHASGGTTGGSTRDTVRGGGGSRSSVNPTIRPGPQEPSGGGDTTPSGPRVSLPYDADSTRDREHGTSSGPFSSSTPQDTSSSLQSETPLFRMTENPFGETPGVKTVPPVFLGSEEDSDEEQPEDISLSTETPDISGIPKTSTPTAQEEEEEMMKNFFPRPVSSQSYQPPGHQPGDFTSHINVNFKKPKGKGGCVNQPCRGVDTDKVISLKINRNRLHVSSDLTLQTG